MVQPEDRWKAAQKAMIDRVARLTEEERFDAALEVARCVLLLDPENHRARLFAGQALLESGQHDQARKVFKSLAQVLDHDVATRARAGLARLLFMEERWEEAWQAFAVRFALMSDVPKLTLNRADGTQVAVPPWDGQGRPERLLVMAEQGLGDTLQFCRYLPRLAERCGEVFFAAPKRLHALLSTLGPSVKLLAREESGSLPGNTRWCSLLDLPRLLALSVEAYGQPSPHLLADKDRIAHWRDALPKGKRLIAIGWRGNPAHSGDRGRSARLADFAALAALEDVVLVVLQQGAGEEIAACAFKDRLFVPEGLDEGENGFADSAAILMVCEALVSVDTSLVHLAGALARPFHVLLARQGSDWRWSVKSDVPVWYPAARIWRQTRFGDYAGVVAELGLALKAHKKPSPRTKASGEGIVRSRAKRNAAQAV